MLPARLNELLKLNSRTFYKTLRILPRAIRSQIGLAYLLARTTDTIADTGIVPARQRLEALGALRNRILGANAGPLKLDELVQHQGSPAERELLENIEISLSALRQLSGADLRLVRQVLDIITSGQELDLRRFDGASAERIVCLQTDAELDDYTYRVAGCVGEFWTRMCRAHLFPDAPLDEKLFLTQAVRFGKGLQLVNILRDLPVDLRQGRCYLPMDSLVATGLSANDLLDPSNQARFKPLYGRYLDLAEAHLRAGWQYTNTVPRNQVRVRLACAWPILIGVETLQRLRDGNILDANWRIKIHRADVRRIMVQSLVRYPLADSWRRLVPSSPDSGVAREADLA